MFPLLLVLGDRMLFRFLQLAGVVLIPLSDRTLFHQLTQYSSRLKVFSSMNTVKQRQRVGFLGAPRHSSIQS